MSSKESSAKVNGDAKAVATPSEKSKTYIAAPRSHHYEFGGPLGAVFVIVAVTFFSYALAFNCSERGCPPFPPFSSNGASDVVEWLKEIKVLGEVDFWKSLWDLDAFVVYNAWYAWTVVCWVVLPGKWVDGVVLRNGEKIQYKINAFATLIVTLAALAGYVAVAGPQPLLFVHEHWIGLVTASFLMSTTQAIYVYAASFGRNRMLALGGNTGNPVYDFFIGRELNPRIGSFDIKTFNELRPGLILWMLIDLSMAAKQYVELGRVTDSMCLVVAFQSWYVIDALYNETAILTTMDIVTDGFGWMLSAGDLLWVPFTYSLQARFLGIFPQDLGLVLSGTILALKGLGYYIFRDSNMEKNMFRNGKNPKNLSYMTTASGSKLLTSGWWSRSRHPNYMGDWLMAWAWCLPAGFGTPLPYFYVVFFAVLLVHRQMRDDEACGKKYGEDWKKYCKLVPSRIIPGVY